MKQAAPDTTFSGAAFLFLEARDILWGAVVFRGIVVTMVTGCTQLERVHPEACPNHEMDWRAIKCDNKSSNKGIIPTTEQFRFFSPNVASIMGHLLQRGNNLRVARLRA